jgi:hypothetical protein
MRRMAPLQDRRIAAPSVRQTPMSLWTANVPRSRESVETTAARPQKKQPLESIGVIFRSKVGRQNEEIRPLVEDEKDRLTSVLEAIERAR